MQMHGTHIPPRSMLSNMHGTKGNISHTKGVIKIIVHTKVCEIKLSMLTSMPKACDNKLNDADVSF